MLAQGLAQIPGVEISAELVKTNIVFFNLNGDCPLKAQQVTDDLRKVANIWLSTAGENRFRAVTHYWIGPAEVETFLDAFRAILTER
jgi:threonine aldolase